MKKKIIYINYLVVFVKLPILQKFKLLRNDKFNHLTIILVLRLINRHKLPLNK